MSSEANPQRRSRLQGLLADRDVDGALITDPVNVRYLSGFTGSNGALIVPMAGEHILVTDGRYRDQARAQAPDMRVIVERELLATCAKLMAGDVASASVTAESRCWAVETSHLSVDAFALLSAAAEPVELVGLDGAVESLRAVKDEQECAYLRTACQISTQALEGLLAGRLKGRTERQIARDLQWRMYELGAADIAFASIVAAGENAAIPHHRPTDRTVRGGDLLKIDFGALFDGYHADCTRTVVIGSPADWQREIYEAVRRSQRAGLAAATAGTAITDVWDAAVGVLDESGWRDKFTTGLGHGVGLRIHEDPFIGPRHTGKLEDRMIVTMEPGVYLPGSGGVRIEDTFVVTDGDAVVLTTMTKDLVEI